MSDSHPVLDGLAIGAGARHHKTTKFKRNDGAGRGRYELCRWVSSLYNLVPLLDFHSGRHYLVLVLYIRRNIHRYQGFVFSPSPLTGITSSDWFAIPRTRYYPTDQDATGRLRHDTTAGRRPVAGMRACRLAAY